MGSQGMFELRYDWATHRRVISGKEVILHCHHYNSRIQHTVESATAVDGKSIIRSSAAVVFGDQITSALQGASGAAAQWQRARDLYAHLGYGDLDMSRVTDGIVEATSSHFVEGWNAGFPGRSEPVCTLAEGFIAGAHHAILGTAATVTETQCRIAGHPRCVFTVTAGAAGPRPAVDKRSVAFTRKDASVYPRQGNVDMNKIVSALVGMPIYGGDDGLIPAFGVYLASTPADFYNLVCIRFIEEMAQHGLARNAQRLLVADAETCAMNTFRGIMSSPEWDGLVAPMCRDEADRLFGIVAVSNALGWGNWYVLDQEPGAHMRIESMNGYEALGFRELRGPAQSAHCFMLRGVAAGIMALVYGTGSVSERFGSYAASEDECICKGDTACSFDVVRA